MVIIEWTLAPWQWILERVEEVPEHPGQDGVVENAHQERYYHGGNAYTQEIHKTFPSPNHTSKNISKYMKEKVHQCFMYVTSVLSNT